VLTEFNEVLLIRKPHTNDGITGAYADLGIGIHKICKSTICCRETSETHRAIFCKGCLLRVVIPMEIDTYDKLALWCQKKIESQRGQEKKLDDMARAIKSLQEQLTSLRSFYEMRA
jgi:hypothetical protein